MLAGTRRRSQHGCLPAHAPCLCLPKGRRPGAAPPASTGEEMVALGPSVQGFGFRFSLGCRVCSVASPRTPLNWPGARLAAAARRRPPPQGRECHERLRHGAARRAAGPRVCTRHAAGLHHQHHVHGVARYGQHPCAPLCVWGGACAPLCGGGLAQGAGRGFPVWWVACCVCVAYMPGREGRAARHGMAASIPRGLCSHLLRGFVCMLYCAHAHLYGMVPSVQQPAVNCAWWRQRSTDGPGARCSPWAGTAAPHSLGPNAGCHSTGRLCGKS